MVKKSTAFCLLIIFLLNAAGFFKVYQFMHQKKEHRQVQLHHKDLLSVTTTTGEEELKEKGFKRLEKNEYEYQGHRYDIVRSEQKDNHTIFYLKYDSYEEELLTFLTSFFSHASKDKDTNTLGRLVEIHKQYILFDYKTPPVRRVVNYVAEHHIISFPSKPYLEIVLPPPRIA